MEEADEILMLSLRQGGCTLPSGITRVGSLEPADVVSICLQCLALANSTQPAATSQRQGLPKEPSKRFRFCSDLALKIQQLGFRGELSFHQFLYPQEDETRLLLRYLADKLSEASEKVSRNSANRRRPLKAVQASSSSPGGGKGKGREAVARRSLPAGVKPGHLNTWSHLAVPSDREGDGEGKGPLEDKMQVPDGVRQGRGPATQEERKKLSNVPHVPLDTTFRREVRFRKHVPQGGAAGSATSGARLRAQTEEEEEEEVNRLQQELAALAVESLELEASTAQVEKDAPMVQRQLDAAREETQRQMRQVAFYKRLTGMLTGEGAAAPDEILARLEADVEERTQQISILESEDQVELRKKLKQQEQRVERELAAAQEAVAELQRQADVADAQTRAREEEQAELAAELQRSPPPPAAQRRSAYVCRISEIARNVKKQDAGTAAIEAATLALQRDVNSARQRLQRTYALVDDLIFRHAKKDPVCKEAYKLLCAIHESFADLAERTVEIERVGRDSREMQDKLEALEKRPVDVAQLLLDLDAVRAENLAMENQLRERQAPPPAGANLS